MRCSGFLCRTQLKSLNIEGDHDTDCLGQKWSNRSSSVYRDKSFGYRISPIKAGAGRKLIS